MHDVCDVVASCCPNWFMSDSCCLERVLKSFGATSAIFVVPPCFLAFYRAVDCWSSRVLMFSYFFIFFTLLLSMMCSPSCRSLNFVPTCRPFSPVLFSVLYRMACSPVRLWALATIYHYLPVFCSHSSRCVTTLFVPNACPSVSYCKILDQFDKTWQDFKHLSESSL